jgi:hypothetical protein
MLDQVPSGTIRARNGDITRIENSSAGHNARCYILPTVKQ